jgi:hypothetical protein
VSSAPVIASKPECPVFTTAYLEPSRLKINSGGGNARNNVIVMPRPRCGKRKLCAW